MSIDSFFYVPAGTRNIPDKKERRDCKLKTVADFVAHHGDRRIPHQVKWVAGGMIDEQYFFEDPEDARWFFAEGWKDRDFIDDGTANGTANGYSPTALWIDDQELKEDSDYFGHDETPTNKPNCECLSYEFCPICDTGSFNADGTLKK